LLIANAFKASRYRLQHYRYSTAELTLNNNIDAHFSAKVFKPEKTIVRRPKIISSQV
jgi:hypothetical protein